LTEGRLNFVNIRADLAKMRLDKGFLNPSSKILMITYLIYGHNFEYNYDKLRFFKLSLKIGLRAKRSDNNKKKINQKKTLSVNLLRVHDDTFKESHVDHAHVKLAENKF
jgi:hypothetical protein